MTYEQSVDFLKSLALRGSKEAVMRYLAASVPIFSGGFPAWVAGLIIGKVLEVAIMKTEFGAFFLFVDIRVDGQKDSFEEAAKLWASSSSEEKAKHEKQYLEKFYNFASLRS